MACLNLRDMQRYLEEPGAVDGGDRLGRHLMECGACRGSFDRVAATNHRVNGWLATLEVPAAYEFEDPRTALARVLIREDRTQYPFAARPASATRSGFATWLLSAKAVSAAIHIAVFSLLMMSFTNPAVQNAIREKVALIDPRLRPWVPDKSSGGGGGGDRSPLHVSKGELPKPAARQFVPPMIVLNKPKLEIDPAIIAPPDPLPQATMPNWGDPLSNIVVLSNGPGSGGGMGSGGGGGVGSGDGPGYGPGNGGGIGDGSFGIGGGISKPVLIYQTVPEYSDEARRIRFSGSVWLSIVVDTEGRAREIRVIKSVGLGLDEKAIEAVGKWRFRPAMRNGHPIAVRATVDVNFRLL